MNLASNLSLKARSIFKNTVVRPCIKILPIFNEQSVILMLHRVGDRHPNRINANQDMVISPNELNSFILDCTREGWTFVSLEQLFFEINSKKKLKKIIALTFDDGYLDNLRAAYPVLANKRVPFAVYITTGFIESDVVPWWYQLESVIEWCSKMLTPDGEFYQAEGLADKNHVFLTIRKKIMSSFDCYHKYLNWIDLEYKKIDCKKHKMFLSWDEVRELSESEIVTIGAHTHTHPVLSNLSLDDAFKEIQKSKEILEYQTGKKINHLAYPYGGFFEASDREQGIARRIGFDTAVTTRFGAVNNQYAKNIFGLPRVFYSPGLSLQKLQKSLQADTLRRTVKKVL